MAETTQILEELNRTRERLSLRAARDSEPQVRWRFE